jgi:hypothetical protein
MTISGQLIAGRMIVRQLPSLVQQILNWLDRNAGALGDQTWPTPHADMGIPKAKIFNPVIYETPDFSDIVLVYRGNPKSQLDLCLGSLYTGSIAERTNIKGTAMTTATIAFALPAAPRAFFSAGLRAKLRRLIELSAQQYLVQGARYL